MGKPLDLVAEYKRCAKLGLNMTETAERLGVSRQAVFNAKMLYDIQFKSVMGREPNWIKDLPLHLKMWIRETMPKGTTHSEFLVALLQDAMNDDEDRKNAAARANPEAKTD